MSKVSMFYGILQIRIQIRSVRTTRDTVLAKQLKLYQIRKNTINYLTITWNKNVNCPSHFQKAAGQLYGWTSWLWCILAPMVASDSAVFLVCYYPSRLHSVILSSLTCLTARRGIYSVLKSEVHNGITLSRIATSAPFKSRSLTLA